MARNHVELTVVSRESVGRTPEQIRRAGHIPAILYGHGVASISVAVHGRSFMKIFPSLSSSTLMKVSLPGEGEPRLALINEVQRDPMTGNPIHIDFLQVNVREKIHATVPLVFEGTSSAVKDLGGILVKNIDEVDVEALPMALPGQLSVDISRLVTFEDRIHVRDLVLPDGVTVLKDADDILAIVTPPRSEEELEALEGEVEERVAEVKTEADEKKAEKEKEAAEEAAAGAPAKE